MSNVDIKIQKIHQLCRQMFVTQEFTFLQQRRGDLFGLVSTVQPAVALVGQKVCQSRLTVENNLC